MINSPFINRLPNRHWEWYKNVGTSPLEVWYVAGMIGCGTPNTGAMSANNLRAWPMYSGKGGVIDRIACNVTTGGSAGSVFRIGLYDNKADTQLYPGSLIVDSGEFDGTTTGVKSATISVVLIPNKIYWYVNLVGTAAPTFRTIPGAVMYSCLGNQSTIPATTNTGVSVAVAYGALPATYPTSAAFVTAGPVMTCYRHSS